MIVLKTSLGDIGIELDYARAPETAGNFAAYVKEGFYKGTVFHRVIRGFMIQGGGLTADLEQKSTRAPIKNEADNGLANDRGTIAMARTYEPHSATSQFFINTVDNDFLNFRGRDPADWGYCVFGRVVSGMDVVDRIEGVKTMTRGGYRDVPRETVEILDALIEE